MGHPVQSIQVYSIRQYAESEYPIFAFVVNCILILHMEKSIHTAEQKKLQRLLRQVRCGAGLRQADLAKLLREGQSFVSKYESGDRRLDVLELRQICRAVGISLTEFVSRLEKSLP